jgi:chemotaxis signal transduction protein
MAIFGADGFAALRSSRDASGQPAAVDLADLEGLLATREIVGLLCVGDVPRNSTMMKGLLQTDGRSIPLIDSRINFTASDPAGTDAASLVIVRAGETELGVILSPAADG